MNKQSIIEDMKVLPEIDSEFEINRRINFIQNQLKFSDLKNLVLVSYTEDYKRKYKEIF